MNLDQEIRVTSHVGRDILSSAASFKTEAAVVWEYVVNSLQYVDNDTRPRIQVLTKPRKREIAIIDNGRGMSGSDLQRFFEMHGENVDRLEGRPGRGKFGTGKSAAFGIGKCLHVETVRNGLRNAVKLHRDTIEASSGESIPIDWEVVNEPTDRSNGTTVTISEIFIPSLRYRPIVEYIERHLQSFRTIGPQVAINDHLCSFKRRDIAHTETFQPTETQSEILGEIELTVFFSASPLKARDQGVAVTAGTGNLVAIETCGIEGKELGAHLFGEVDCPRLESYETPIAPYDATRDLELNPNHPVAQALIAFLGSSLEEVRKERIKRLRKAQESEQSRRLAAEADRISDILNSDFREVRDKLNQIRTPEGRPGDLTGRFGRTGDSGSGNDAWIEGTSNPGDVFSTSKVEGQVEDREKKQKRPDPNLPKSGQPCDEGEAAVDPIGTTGKNKARPRGGFRVDFKNDGPEARRSRYEADTFSIIINLEHPAVASALDKANSVEDINFLRIVYEIAFVEYSLAFARELTEQDPDMPADDLLYEIGTTLNRIASKAVLLY